MVLLVAGFERTSASLVFFCRPAVNHACSGLGEEALKGKVLRSRFGRSSVEIMLRVFVGLETTFFVVEAVSGRNVLSVLETARSFENRQTLSTCENLNFSLTSCIARGDRAPFLVVLFQFVLSLLCLLLQR